MKYEQVNKNSTFIEEKIALFGTEDPERDFVKSNIALIKDAASSIEAAMKANMPIKVVGDYDCDGQNFLIIMGLIFRAYGYSNYTLRAPKRISEGYGLSDKIVDEIIKTPMGLCILGDNGIKAISQVQRLIDFGWDVIILDHHEASDNGVLPPAGIIIDPAAIEQSKFHCFCGAGLAYKLACEMKIDKKIMKQISSFAAIATVADSVDLIDSKTKAYDNYMIIKRGLKTMLDGGVTKGLYVLLRKIGLDYAITEKNLGYLVGPIFNAPGRLIDDGSNLVIGLMLDDSSSFSVLEAKADTLIALNNKRKEIEAAVVEKVNKQIHEEEISQLGATPKGIVVVFSEETPEGVAGLISGQLTQERKIPSIAFACSGDPDIIKGSARSCNGVNMIELLNKHNSLIKAYGGHAGAAGLSIYRNNFDAFKKELEDAIGPYVQQEEIAFYDYEILQSDVQAVYKQIQKFAPFGNGNPEPIFRIKDFASCAQQSGEQFRILGAKKKTIKIFGFDCDLINFTGKGLEEFEKKNFPSSVDVIGTLNENSFHGKKSLQMNFSAIKPA